MFAAFESPITHTYVSRCGRSKFRWKISFSSERTWIIKFPPARKKAMRIIDEHFEIKLKRWYVRNTK